MSHEKKRISVYFRNSLHGPSDYYRVGQYLSYLGYEIKENNALTRSEFSKNLDMPTSLTKKIYQAWLLIKIYTRRLKSLVSDLRNPPDIIIVQREIYPHIMGPISAIILKKISSRSKIIWDYDDDIFNAKEISRRERTVLEQGAQRIVVISDYLKTRLSNYAQQKTVLLPTTDGFCKHYNLDTVNFDRIKKYKQEIDIVWVGTQSNLNNVEMIIPHLDNAAARLEKQNSKKLVLTVVCNVPIHVNTSKLIIRNIKWEREVAEKEIVYAHIGIMPLRETKSNLGKGGFKLVQYISMGLPVIASDVGYNREIVTPEIGYLIDNKHLDEWESTIMRQGTSEQLWIRQSNAAKKRYEKGFSFDANLRSWIELLESVMKG